MDAKKNAEGEQEVVWRWYEAVGSGFSDELYRDCLIHQFHCQKMGSDRCRIRLVRPMPRHPEMWGDTGESGGWKIQDAVKGAVKGEVWTGTKTNYHPYSGV